LRTERDTDRFAATDADRDPEMIDVRRDAIDFRGEGDGSSSEMDEVALVQPKVIPPGLLSASMWQAFKERT